MVNLQVTEQELQIILVGLGELPAKHSAALLMKIHSQVQATQKAQNEPQRPE